MDKLIKHKHTIEVVRRMTPLGMKEYLLLDGALWDVDEICDQIRREAAVALVDKETRDLVEKMEREILENANMGRDASRRSALLNAER
jgi:hypothetical protein